VISGIGGGTSGGMKVLVGHSSGDFGLGDECFVTGRAWYNVKVARHKQ